MLDQKLQETLDSLNTIDTIDLSGFNGISSQDLTTITSTTLPTLTTAQLNALTPTISIGAIGQGYTIAGGGTTGNFNWQSPNVWTTTNATSAVGATMTVGNSGLLDIKGDNADIAVNGKSLMKTLERIEDRLNLLVPNPELEKEWDDLRKLGERYRRLEKKCKEKAETWKKLKAMPPPRVD